MICWETGLGQSKGVSEDVTRSSRVPTTSAVLELMMLS